MSQATTPDNPDAVLWTNRIINGALLAGPLMFLGIVLMIRSRDPKGMIVPAGLNHLTTVLALAALALTACNLLLAWLMPDRIAAAQRRAIAAGKWKPPADPAPIAMPTTETGQLLAVWQTGRILRLALIEAAAFFAAIVFMMEGSAGMLGLCVALLILIAWQFPTSARLDAWLDDQTERLRQERTG